MNSSELPAMMAVVLWIHFTPSDLGRVRLATRSDPLWEIVGSLHRLQSRVATTAFDGWLHHARGQLRQPAIGQAARTLAPLTPRDLYFPDFLTPPEPARCIESGVEAVLSTSRERIARELDQLGRRRRLPAWIGQLAGGDPNALRSLGRALHTYHQALIVPHAARIEATLARHRAPRIRALCETGTEGLLAGLGPAMRWSPPVLEVDYPVEQELHLEGRGLLLVPSYFCWRTPVTLADPELPPVLVYPVRHEVAPATGTSRVAALLGRTRAAVLEASGDGATTTTIARQLGISPATASHHATILRDAGLIVGIREANRVIHSRTPLGEDLLSQQAAG